MKSSITLKLTAVLFFLVFSVLTGTVNAQEEISIHGFLSTGYLNSSNNNYLLNTEGGTFQFNEFALNFTKELNDRTRLSLQLLSRKLGEFDDGKMEVNYAFGDYDLSETSGIRFGRIKSPISLYNQQWDLDFLRTTVLLPTGFYGEEMRIVMDTLDGVSYRKTFFSEKPNTLDFEAIYGSGEFPENFVWIKKLAVRIPGSQNWKGDNPYAYYARFTLNTALEGLRLGYTKGFNEANFDFTMPVAPGVNLPIHMDTDADIEVYFLEYMNEHIKLAAESRTYDCFSVLSTGATRVADESGWYALLDYYIDDKLTLGGYYSEFHPDRHDKDGTLLAAAGAAAHGAWQKDKCLALKYNIQPNWNVKFEIHDMDGTGQIYSWINTNNQVQKDWTLYALKTTYSF